MNTKLLRNLALSCLAVAVLATWPGCHRSQAQPSASAPATTKAAPAKTLTKIVFVDKEHACDCTRKAVDAGWAALQKALETPNKLPVQRFHVDTQAAQVDPYRSQKAIMAMPAIYFVDEKESVLDMLQGEVTEAQIQPVLSALSAGRSSK
jgi:hypothetical protein